MKQTTIHKKPDFDNGKIGAETQLTKTMKALEETYELLKRETKTRVIGLMSGTSADGIDAAVVEIEGHGVETRVALLAFETFPFPPGVREAILALCHPETGRVDDLCEMNFHLGHLFAEAVKHLLQKNDMDARDIALIGSHGQTVHHLPEGSGKAVLSCPSTLQIGEPAVIAHETGIPTIADFRVADVAAGGQGAPLVSYTDYLLFRDSHETIGLLNIGGIANLTVLPANASLDSVSAADTGPGNMAIDAVVSEMTGGRERYDAAGQRAALGTAYQPLIDEWLKHPFFQLGPPKTTGRELFGSAFVATALAECRTHGLDDNACIATLTELTVQSIALFIHRFVSCRRRVSLSPPTNSLTTIENSGKPLDRLYVSGGGAHNLTLMKRLSEVLPDTSVAPIDSTGMRGDAKEAIAFAILANEALHGNSGNIPTATGASVRKILGKFVWP